MGIEQVPTVFLVYQGNVVDSFVGVPDQKRLDDFFNTISLLIGNSEDDNTIKSLLKSGDELLNKKQWDQAENLFNEAFTYEKWRKKYGATIKLGLAYCSYSKNEYNQTEKIMKELNEKYSNDIKHDEELRKRISNLEIKIVSKKNPSLISKNLETLESEIEKKPDNMENRYQLALQYFEQADFERSINSLLEIMKIERNWNNKAAQNFLLKIFNFLGANHTLTIAGRKNLSKILF